MNMHINETWNDQTVMDLYNGKTGTGEIGGNGNNTAVGNGNIGVLKRPAAEDRSACEQQLHG